MVSESKVSYSLRRLLRRSLRAVLTVSPEPLRRAAARVPFSRYHTVASELFRGEEVICWRGLRIKLNPGEVHGYYPYFLGDYSGSEIDQIIRECRRGPVVVADVGANIGLTSLALARACPEIQVFAFEPSPAVAARFQENLDLNPELARRVRLVRQAVDSRDGTACFQPSPAQDNSGIGRVVTGAAQPGACEVPAVRLDTFFAGVGQDPTVVKIDVEGHELSVLEGMAGLFARGVPQVLFVEVHGFYHGEFAGTFNRKVRSLLEGAGYELYELDGAGWRRCPAAQEWPNRLHVLALRPGLAPAAAGPR